MLQILINFIFNVVLTIIQFILSPFLLAVTALFPDISTVVSSILMFLTQSLTYVTTILRLLLFTPDMFTLLFDYFVIKYSIFGLVSAIKFTVNLYNKLKP